MANALEILRERGFVQQTTGDDGIRALLDGGRITTYNGFDATAPSLHIGHLVPVMALAHIQRCGHRPIALIGGGTTLVGDPSGRSEARPLLVEEEIGKNADRIAGQIGRYVTLDGERGLFLNNADWLLSLNYVAFLREIGRHFSVNRMIAAEAYRARLETGLSFLEFNYQVLQAYDYLVLYRAHRCTLQTGGDDQWGNILAGVDLVRRVEGAEVHAMTCPLLTTSTGAKMGKTAAGAVWLDGTMCSPHDFFQYWVNVDDRDVERFLGIFTFLPMEEVRRLGSLRDAATNEAKEILAWEVTRLCHGEAAADRARGAARAVFGGGGDDSGLPVVSLSAEEVGKGIGACDLYVRAGLAKSKSDARRLIEQGGASVGETQVRDWKAVLGPAELRTGARLWAGKKRVVRIVVRES